MQHLRASGNRRNSRATRSISVAGVEVIAYKLRMKRKHVVVGMVLLGAGCGGGTSSSGIGSVANRSAAGNAEEAAAMALADIAKLNADYTCECADGNRSGRCSAEIVTEVKEDPTIAIESAPGGLTYDQTLSLRAIMDTCWGQVADWEDARGLKCLGRESETKPGARKSCGNPVRYELATVDAWWKSATACGKGQYLVTKPNPMIPGALLLAHCAEKREYDIEYPVGRVTEWYVHGGVKSDRTAKSRTEWYPHGQKHLEVTTGSKPVDGDGNMPTMWTHYHLNGQVSDKGQRVWKDLFGTWEGFRKDGTLLYRATQEIAVGTTVKWFDRDGKEVPEEPMPPEVKAILDKRAAANTTP
jgi:hypothetical protein